MDLPEQEQDQDWGVPVLYLRDDDGNIFPEFKGSKRKRNIYHLLPIVLLMVVLIVVGVIVASLLM